MESATAAEVVLSCTPEKSTSGPNYKFVYNMRSRALVKQIDYQPFAMRKIFSSRGGTAVLVGSNDQQLVAIRYSPAVIPPFELLNESEAMKWTERIGEVNSGHTHLSPEGFMPIRFGPGNQFTLTQRNETKNNSSEDHFIVVDHRGKTPRVFSLPQSTYNEFSRVRPLSVRNGNTRQATTIDETIGPTQIVKGTLWFGKTFYDGEGLTGIGGFGYFDSEARKSRIFDPPEIVEHSVTAINVEPEAIWLTLADHAEYRSPGVGLLRLDRVTGKVERMNCYEYVDEIARIGDQLLLATNFGASVVERGRIHRFFVDRTIQGRLHVSEAVGY